MHLATVGLILATQTTSVVWFIAFFSVAIFGIDMILSPSWAFCNDIGGANSGAGTSFCAAGGLANGTTRRHTLYSTIGSAAA